MFTKKEVANTMVNLAVAAAGHQPEGTPNAMQLPM